MDPHDDNRTLTISGPFVYEGEAAHSGISLRDYFAAKALPAILALSEGKFGVDWVSRHAYRVADAMLEAKENSNEND